MNKDWQGILVVGACVLAFILLICLSVAMAKDTNTPENLGYVQHIRMDLPMDFGTALSVTNNKNGVILAYTDQDGNVKAVQYANGAFDYSYKFHFERTEQ